MDRIPQEHCRVVVPDGLRRNIVDGISRTALPGPYHLPDDRLLFAQTVEHARTPRVTRDRVVFPSLGLLRLRERDKPGDLTGRADVVPNEGALAKDEVQRVWRRWKG